MILVAYVYVPRDNPYHTKFSSKVVHKLDDFINVCKAGDVLHDITIISISEITNQQAELLKGE